MRNEFRWDENEDNLTQYDTSEPSSKQVHDIDVHTLNYSYFNTIDNVQLLEVYMYTRMQITCLKFKAIEGVGFSVQCMHLYL